MLDLRRPDISGEEVCVMLTEHGGSHRVLSCNADMQLVESYRSLAAKEITEPAPVTDLQQAVPEIACKGSVAADPDHGE